MGRKVGSVGLRFWNFLSCSFTYCPATVVSVCFSLAGCRVVDLRFDVPSDPYPQEQHHL